MAEELQTSLYDIEILGRYEKDFKIRGHGEFHIVRLGTLTTDEYIECLIKTSQWAHDELLRERLLEQEILVAAIISIDGIKIENEVQREWLRKWVGNLTLPVRNELVNAYKVLELEQQTVLAEFYEEVGAVPVFKQLKELKGEE